MNKCCTIVALSIVFRNNYVLGINMKQRNPNLEQTNRAEEKTKHEIGKNMKMTMLTGLTRVGKDNINIGKC